MIGTFTMENGDKGTVLGFRDANEKPTHDLDKAVWVLVKSDRDQSVFTMPVAAVSFDVMDDPNDVPDNRH